jgi:hypothetical protein
MGLLRDPTLSPQVGQGERVAADGAFKTPGLRNVELTAPYMHNGGQGTLMQVIDFYNRGGDRTGTTARDSTGFGPNGSNLDTDVASLGLTAGEKADLVAFLLALTDERVRHRGAPFDHPQLFVPNGHPWDRRDPGKVAVNPGTGNAADDLVEIPAVGRTGACRWRPSARTSPRPGDGPTTPGAAPRASARRPAGADRSRASPAPSRSPAKGSGPDGAGPWYHGRGRVGP